MPSPFPGMDPYLEAPVFWPGAHNLLIGAMTRALNNSLPPGFAANLQERIYIQPQQRSVYPDVLVRRDASTKPTERGGSVAVAEPVNLLGGILEAQDTPHEVFILSQEVKEWFIDVVTTDDEQKVVTTIEVLSPANKTAGEGQRQYHSKQQALLRSDTHFLEIDLLRQGGWAVAVSEVAVRQYVENWDYLFCLHRGGSDRYQFWSKTIRQTLPRKILVPLTVGVPDVLLDLQAAFTDAYVAGPYARQVDYSAAAYFPLAGANGKWAEELLQTAGLRPPPD